MRHTRFYFILVFIWCGSAFAQNAIADWFPVHVGDKWTYQHETRDENGGGSAHLDVGRWETEETIAGSWTIPEGTLLGKQVRVVQGSLPTGYRADVYSDQAYLIRGDCLYLNYVGWEPLNHQLTAEFRAELSAGQIAPDFCFPLSTGKTWGAAQWADGKDWRVASVKQKTFHVTSVSSYLGSGITADIWFEKGVGIVREEQIHHGTIGEIRTRLLRFEPASQR